MDIVKTLPTVISIHAPTRGATPGPATVNSFSLFQSTLPRGERPSWGSNLLAKAAISIHAPTRGATLIDLFIRIFLDNFNPRSHEGSDDYTPNSRTISSDFNPRSHEGSDPACFYPETGKIISIHAPTRGATDPEYHRNLVQKKFQSTLPRGERLNCTMTAIIKLLFQSTLPRGERPEAGRENGRQVYISIHAPTRGATPISAPKTSYKKFQSTLPRGERQQFSPKSSLFSQQKLSKIFNLNNKLF